MHSFNDDKAHDDKAHDDKAAPPYSETASSFTPEQDNRPLPEGWIRQWDQNHQAYFFVDTKANPPRSIWDHPLDDVQYRKAHGLPADSDSESTTSSSSSSSSSDSERDEKKKSGKKLKRQETPNHAGPSKSTAAGGGLLGILGQALFGPRPSHPVSPGVAGPSTAPMQAAMMYPPPPYPYSRREMKRARRSEKRVYRQEKREEKRAYRKEKREDKRAYRAEKSARKQERRMLKAQQKAARKGYAIPGVAGTPQPPQMPQMPQMPPMPRGPSGPQVPLATGVPPVPGIPPVPGVPSVPGTSRGSQPAPGYSMPSEKYT